MTLTSLALGYQFYKSLFSDLEIHYPNLVDLGALYRKRQAQGSTNSVPTFHGFVGLTKQAAIGFR